MTDFSAFWANVSRGMTIFFEYMGQCFGVRFIQKMLLFGAGFSLLVSCQSGDQLRQVGIDQVFQKQLLAHIPSITHYQKNVEDLTLSPPVQEDTLYQGMPKVGAESEDADSSSYLLLRDLAYTFESYYANPSLIDRYEVEQQGDTTIARLSGEADPGTPLKAQWIVYGQDSATFAFVRTRIQKETLLYDFAVDIAVTFDSIGRYTRHTLELTNDISLNGSAFHTRIMGKASYK